MFRQFYDATPGIYAGQWIDANGVNRFGYPADNSLTGYDFRAGQCARDAEFGSIINRTEGGDP